MELDKNRLRERVSLRVEAHRDDLIAITQDLVRIPSVNPPGDYGEISQRMFGLYKAEGLEPVVCPS